jgi:hypothetical protein
MPLTVGEIYPFIAVSQFVKNFFENKLIIKIILNDKYHPLFVHNIFCFFQDIKKLCLLARGMLSIQVLRHFIEPGELTLARLNSCLT